VIPSAGRISIGADTMAGVTTGYAAAERAALADSLWAAGPDEPTLCEGWTTRDLAAHVVLRERSPVAATGIVVKQMAGFTDRVRRRIAAEDYGSLVEKVRHPARWSPQRLPAVDEAMNVLEFFVHHEDVRRGRPGWQARTLDAGHQQALYQRLRGSAKLSTRRFGARITVEPEGYEPFEVGAGGERVTVRGPVGELVLFFTGRQRASNVEVDGPPALVARLRTARLGV
jgi:uncharacterized protein (TIGR03085 family)